MSIELDDILIQSKEDMYFRVLSDATLANVPVLIDDEHDLDNRAKVNAGPKNYRNSKTGACIIVAAVGVSGLNSGETPTPLMSVSIGFEVLENPIVNEGPDGTGINAGEIFARLVQLCHAMHIDGGLTGLRLSQSNPVQEIESDEAGERGFFVRFDADDMAVNCVPTTASVSASYAAGEVTLTCSTPSATIYYTTDGSYPGEGNPEAQTYTGAFEADAGETIRAAAVLADYNASKVITSFTI